MLLRGVLLQPLGWRCVECVIHHKRDVREEQHSYICCANKQQQTELVGWSLLLLAAAVRSFAHMPLGHFRSQQNQRPIMTCGSFNTPASLGWFWHYFLPTRQLTLATRRNCGFVRRSELSDSRGSRRCREALHQTSSKSLLRVNGRGFSPMRCVDYPKSANKCPERIVSSSNWRPSDLPPASATNEANPHLEAKCDEIIHDVLGMETKRNWLYGHVILEGRTVFELGSRLHRPPPSKRVAIRLASSQISDLGNIWLHAMRACTG